MLFLRHGINFVVTQNPNFPKTLRTLALRGTISNTQGIAGKKINYIQYLSKEVFSNEKF
jgi:hypothetical protein